MTDEMLLEQANLKAPAVSLQEDQDGSSPLAPTEKEGDAVAPLPSPEDAARFLVGAIPAFRNTLDKVTGVQAKRVLMALTEAPLNEEQPKFTTKEALQLYELGLMITNSKFILFKNADETSKDLAKVQEMNANKEETNNG